MPASAVARSSNLDDRSALLAGLALVAAFGVAYPLVRHWAGQPLAMFVLAPLLAAALAGGWITLTVGTAAVVIAALVGAADDMRTGPLVARLAIVASGTVLAAAAAQVRRRREEELREVQVRDALATTLQNGLVPVPHPPAGVNARTRYRPGERGLLLGGDFVDVVSLPDGTAGFVIGDVCGHDARAAAFGTAIRAAWKGIAFTAPTDPVRWLRELEAAYFDDGRYDGFVTVLAGRLEPGSGHVDMVSAGHCWPILTGPDTALIELHPGLPLGIEQRTVRTSHSMTLPPSAELLLYTDGLIENRLAPQGVAGESTLVRVLAGMTSGVDLDVLLSLLGPTGFQDDVALLLLSCQASTGNGGT